MADGKWKTGRAGSHYKERKGIFHPELIPQKDWAVTIKNAEWIKKHDC